MLINKKSKTKDDILNLEKLVTNFQLDITLKDNVPELKSVPAFISKSYYQIQNLNRADKSDFSYNYPPKGPIEPGFMCVYCEREGPNYHKESCRRPFNSSLVLSRVSDRFKGAEEGTRYDLLVKKSGQKKIVSKRARSQTFTDNVEILYENEMGQHTTVRISRNGVINIISAQMNDTDLPELIFYRINKTNAVLNSPFKINDSYRYLISAQFNLIPENRQKDLLIDLNTLNANLWNVFRKKVQGKDAFMVGSASNYYFINKYNYNSGEQYSRSNKMTNPYIQFNLIDFDVKIHVMIYKRGAVQLRGSHLDPESTDELNYSILEKIYIFLKQLLEEVISYSSEAGYDIITNEVKSVKKSKIPNMVDGKQPKMCHNRSGTVAGSGDFRPVPYSFYGTCPMDGYYVKGIKRPDGKYEPCCRKLKSDPKSPDFIGRYHNNILNGYPDGLFDETVTPGDSAVFVPGTKIVEPRSYPGLNNMNENELRNFMESAGYLRDSSVFEKEYSSFKQNLKLPKFTFKPIKPLVTLDTFTKNAYLVTPIPDDTIRVKLYIDNEGKSYFINEFGEISESGIETIEELKGTELEGFLFPFMDPEFIFYPFDISFYKNSDISKLDYYSSSEKRWNYLKSVVNIVTSKNNSLKIEMNFDLNIIQGSNYFIQFNSKLLFIPFSGKETRIWSDTLHDYNITISLNAQKLKENRWRITVENKTLPTELVQQGKENDIELPVAFTKGKGDNLILLCKINLKRTNFKIENRKPFIPLEILEAPLNTYSEVISILESINSPIDREVFVSLNQNPIGFSFHGKVYYQSVIGEPLAVSSVV